MMLLRDQLAAQIAAALTQSALAPSEIARRAYAVADAMLFERAELSYADYEQSWDAGPSHDPRWELEPRWSPEDLAALDQKRGGPGLAKSQVPGEEQDERTGTD